MNNSNNLNELNSVLFDTLRGVKDGTIDAKKAQTVTNVANSIISNAKTQLSAYKLTNGEAYSENFGALPPISNPSISTSPELKPASLLKNDKHAKMYDFAKSKGYKSVTEAMSHEGKHEFTTACNNWLDQL